MPNLATAARAGVRKPSGNERAGSRAPGTAQRYEDFAPATGMRAAGAEAIEALADRGYYSGKEILACGQAGVTVYVPRVSTSNAKAEGRYDKQDFVYKADEDVYLCPAGERLTYRFTNKEDGKVLRRYCTTACSDVR